MLRRHVTTSAAEQTQGSSKMGSSEIRTRKSPRRAISVLLGVLCSVLALGWLMRSIETKEMIAHLKSARLDSLFYAVVLTCLSYILRSVRWPFFFSEKLLTFADSYRCLIIGFFMNNTLPARMGEFVRAHLGGRAAKCSRTAVLATIAGERIVDGLVISLIFATLFTIGAKPEEMELGGDLFPVALFFAVASAGLVITILIRSFIFSLLERGAEQFQGKLSSFTIVRIRSFIDGLEPMLGPKKLAGILSLSFIVWGIELAVYSQIAAAFGQNLSIGVLSLFLAAVNFSSLIPSAPGGIGVIELFATAALTNVGVDREVALAMVASQHVIQIAVVGIPGSYLFFSKLGGRLPMPENGIEG